MGTLSDSYKKLRSEQSTTPSQGGSSFTQRYKAAREQNVSAGPTVSMSTVGQLAQQHDANFTQPMQERAKQWYSVAPSPTTTQLDLGALKAQRQQILDGWTGSNGAVDRKELDRLNRIIQAADTSYEDKFTGQTAASYTQGRLAQDESLAWYTYMKDPTEENLRKAQEITTVLQSFQRNNAQTLDKNATAPWISQSLAGYIPQLMDQTAAQFQGAAVGGAAGSVVPGVGTALGMKAGYMAGAYKYSSETMTGAAFKQLLELGVDADIARALAQDEGFESGLIEMAEAGLDIMTLGLGNVINMATKGGAAKAATKVAGTKLMQALKKYAAHPVVGYLANIGSEALEEGAQQSISIANRNRALAGVDTGKAGLARDATSVAWNALTGQNQKDRAEIGEAMAEGAKIAAMMGGVTRVATYASERLSGQGPAAQSTTTPTAAHSPAAAQAGPKTQETAKATAQAQQAPLGQPVQTEKATVLDRGTTLYLNRAMEDSGQQKTKAAGIKRAQAKAKLVQKLIDGKKVDLGELSILNLTNAKYRAIFAELTGIQFPAGMTRDDQLRAYVLKTHEMLEQQRKAAQAENNVAEAAEIPMENVAETAEIPAGNVAETPVAETPVAETMKGLATFEQFAQAYREQVNPAATDEEIRPVFERYEFDNQTVQTRSGAVTRAQFREAVRKSDRGANETDEAIDAYFDYLRDNQAEQSRPVAETLATETEPQSKPASAAEQAEQKTGDKRSVLSKRTQKLLSDVEKKLGVKIEVVDHITPPTREEFEAMYRAQHEDRADQIDAGEIDQAYEEFAEKVRTSAEGEHKAGVIRLSLNARKSLTRDEAILQILRHELTHYLQRESPETYQRFVDFVVNNVPDYQTRFKAKAKDYEGAISAKQKSKIDDEVAAHYAELLFTDEEFVRLLAGKDRKLLQTFIDFIDNLLAKLNGAEFADVRRVARNAQELWKAALNATAEAQNASDESVVHGKERVSVDGSDYSFRSMSHDIREGTMYKDLTSPKTLSMLGMKKSDIDKLFRQLQDLLDYMAPHLAIVDYNEEYGKNDRPFHPYKENSDPLYKISLDFSTLCTKRLLMQHVIERLQVMEKKPMSAAKQMAVREKIKQYAEVEKGLQVACAMCYVESARLHSPEQVQHYLDNPGAIVTVYLSKKSKAFNAQVEKLQTEIKTKYGFKASDPKSKLSSAARKEFDTKSKELRLTYKPTAEEQALIDTANSLPVETYLTAENLTRLSQEHPEIYDAFTSYIRSATRSKSSQTPVPYYYGDSKTKGHGGKKVSKKFIDSMNAENGMRFSSWSDYMFKHVLDMMTAVIELSVRGSSMHGYTKFPQFVRVFGKTGMMFNLSGVADGMGLDEKGGLLFSPSESVDIAEARKVRGQYPETAGVQCIGVSDDHIRKLMATDWIDYIIPYHVSGMSAALRRLAGIAGWKDYSDVQHAKPDPKAEKTGGTMWHKEPVFSEFFVQDNPGDGLDCMRRSAERYKELCRQRGLIPKFEAFTDDPNYWKLLIDRKMINQRTGALIFQKPVKPIFNFREIRKQIRQEVANYDPEREQRVFDYIVANMDDVEAIAQNVQAEMDAGAKKKASGVEAKAAELGNEMTATAVIGDGESQYSFADEVAYLVGGSYNTTRRYWYPDFNQAEWDLWNSRVKQEVDTTDQYVIDESVKWLYADQKGVQVFGLYSTSHPEDPTLLYASSGAKARREYRILMGVQSNGGDATNRARGMFARVVKAIKRRKGGAAHADVLAGDGSPTVGDVRVPAGERGSDRGADPAQVQADSGRGDVKQSEDGESQYSFASDDADQMEIRLNELREERAELTDQLDFADFDDSLTEADIRKTRNRLFKVQAEIDKIVAAERRATVLTPMQTILANLSNYRRSDLESLAEQISDSAWDGYEELTRAELEDALREIIEGREYSPLEMQSAEFGLWVRPPKVLRLGFGESQFSFASEDQTPKLRQEFIDSFDAQFGEGAAESMSQIFEQVLRESEADPPATPASQSDGNMIGCVIYKTGANLGSAALGFDPYSYLQNEYGTIPQTGRHNHRVADVPKSTDGRNKVHKTTSTVWGAQATPESRLPTIADAVVNDQLSYLPTTNKGEINRARQKIRRLSFPGALKDWHRAVSEGKVNGDLVAMGATLLNNAGNAGADGKTYIDILVTYSQLLHDAGEALQAANILKRLTPEGRLYAVVRQVQRMNEEAKDPRHDTGLPVSAWMDEVGELLADEIYKRIDVKESREKVKTVADTILEDLVKYARDLVARESPVGMATTRTEMERLQDLFNNKDKYDEAWQVAKNRLVDEFGNDPNLYAALEAWVESELTLSDKLTKILTGQKEIVMSEDLAAAYLSAKTDAERAELMERILQNIADQVDATLEDKLAAWRYTAMLGNLRTIARNTSGNALMVPLRMTKSVFAGLLEAMIQKAGINIDRTTSVHRDAETLKAAKDVFQEVRDIISNGGKYRDIRSNLPAEIRKRQRIYKTAWLEGARKIVSAAMDNDIFGDGAFSYAAFADALSRYIAANGTTWSQASDELKDRATQRAIREAAEATFRDNNALSNAIVRMRFRNPENNVTRGINLIWFGIQPFLKTPANVLVRSVEYSPIGFVNAVRRTVQKGLNDAELPGWARTLVGKTDLTANDIIEAYSKGLTGSAVVMLGFALASMGILRGKAPDDEKERELWEMQGHQEYSLEIGNTSYTIDWAAPLSIPLLVGAELQDATLTQGLTVREGLSVVSTVFDPLLEMSMMQGISDAISNAQTYGDDSAIVRFVGNALWSYVTQYVPTIFGQAERGSVNTRMTTYPDKNKDVPDAIQRALGTTSAKVPGWDYAQTVYIDAWGRTQQNAENPMFNALEQFMSPGYANTVTETAMERELLRLKQATGESSVLISSAPKYFNVDSKRKDLTADEYLTYAKYRGQTAFTVVTEMTESASYAQLSDKQKAAAVIKAYDYSNQVAKQILLGDSFKPESWVEEAQQAVEEYGIPVDTYLTAYAATKDVKGIKDKEGKTVTNSAGLRTLDILYSLPELTEEQVQRLAENFDVGKTVLTYSAKLVKRKLEAMERRYG